MTEERTERYLNKFRDLASKVMDDDLLEEDEKHIVLEIASEEIADFLED